MTTSNPRAASTPELGPWLGVVGDPRPRPSPPGLDLDPIRQALVARLLVEARQDGADWLGAWTVAAAAASDAVLQRLDEIGTRAAWESRAPERLARTARPDEDDARLVRARVESAGIPVEEAVAALDSDPQATRQLARIGGAIEEAWLDLERIAAAVVIEWVPRAEAVRRWRRPTGMLWLVTTLAGLLALLGGAMIGGYLPAPGWFRPVIQWWWELPWP